jgi:DNA-binding LytR/AlgR family response regulator
MHLLQFFQANRSTLVNINGIELVTKIRQFFRI